MLTCLRFVIFFQYISSLLMLLYMRLHLLGESSFNLSKKHGIKLFELAGLTTFHSVKYQAVNFS